MVLDPQTRQEMSEARFARMCPEGYEDLLQQRNVHDSAEGNKLRLRAKVVLDWLRRKFWRQ